MLFSLLKWPFILNSVFNLNPKINRLNDKPICEIDGSLDMD